MSKLILHGRVFPGLWVGGEKNQIICYLQLHFFLPLMLFSIITREKLWRFSFFKKEKKPITLYKNIRPQWHLQKLRRVKPSIGRRF